MTTLNEEYLELKQRCVAYIDAMYVTNISNASLCAVLGVSDRKLRSALEAYGDLTVSQLITQKRMERARAYLEEGSVAIRHVFTKVGYSSQRGFEIAFQKHFGLSPQAYVKALETKTPRAELALAAPQLTDTTQQAIIEYVNNYFTEPDIYSYDVAKQFGIGEATLQLLFKTYYRKSFKDQVRWLRFQRAASMLVSTDLDPKVICERVGYKSYHYFVTHFTKMFDMGPKRYRDWERLKISNE